MSTTDERKLEYKILDEIRYSIKLMQKDSFAARQKPAYYASRMESECITSNSLCLF
jgi:hypothetical protein